MLLIYVTCKSQVFHARILLILISKERRVVHGVILILVSDKTKLFMLEYY